MAAAGRAGFFSPDRWLSYACDVVRRPYEELSADKDGAMEGVFSFLGLSPVSNL